MTTRTITLKIVDEQQLFDRLSIGEMMRESLGNRLVNIALGGYAFGDIAALRMYGIEVVE